jgi:hypothetical protein
MNLQTLGPTASMITVTPPKTPPPSDTAGFALKCNPLPPVNKNGCTIKNVGLLYLTISLVASTAFSRNLLIYTGNGVKELKQNVKHTKALNMRQHHSEDQQHSMDKPFMKAEKGLKNQYQSIQCTT